MLQKQMLGEIKFWNLLYLQGNNKGVDNSLEITFGSSRNLEWER